MRNGKGYVDQSRYSIMSKELAIDEEHLRLVEHADTEEEYVKFNEVVEKRANSRLRNWLIGVSVCLCAYLLISNSFTYDKFTISRVTSVKSINNRQENENEIHATTETTTSTSAFPGFVVKTKGCRIPAFEVLDDNIKRYFADTTSLECQAGNYLPLINSNLTSLLVDPRAKPHFYKDNETLDCCWREFWRGNQTDNSITYDKVCQSFDKSTRLKSEVEFVKVECSRQGKEIYKDYHAFVPRKPLVEKRCKNLSTIIAKADRLSVLILGLDAVSRLNFHRTMPLTVAKLKQLKAVEMLGYNKVADNTFPNMVPVLTGMSEYELSKTCWTGKKKTFDDCSFLWNNFSANGYRTIFGEDACDMTIFNYVKSGFKNQPTDYYLRPYCLGSENDIGNTHKLNADLCVGTRKTFDNLLDYAKKIANEFSNDRYFAFFWQASLTHDFVNYPKFGDNSYSSFLNDVHSNGSLNNTALILMSDHGIRWGGFRQTYQGQVEESLPFVFIVLPEWWIKKYPVSWANLRRNTKSLTTPYDLHETLLNLLKFDDDRETSSKNLLINEKKISTKVPRGLSWFHPVPDNRNCEMAGIPGHWCSCHLSKNTSINDNAVKLIVNFLINELNLMIKNYPQCSKLELNAILDAKIWTDESNKQIYQTKGKKIINSPTIDYTVTIKTKPGDAIFEATVRHGTTKDFSNKLVGSVSRLNLYGKQSACVDDFKMRLYCFCG